MKYIFFIACFNAFFFAVLLLQKKPRALHDNILVSWLTFLGVYTGLYGLYSDILFAGFPLLSASFISLLMLHGVFFYLYVQALVLQQRGFEVKNLLHFIPFLLFNIYLLAVSFFSEFAHGIRLDHPSGDHDTPILFNIFLILTALSGPVYFVLTNKLLQKLDVDIYNNLSYADNINPAWLRKLVIIFGIIWTALMIVAAIHHVFHLFSWIFCTHGIFLSLSFFIILIGFFGLKQKEIFSHYEKQLLVKDSLPQKYSGSGLKETQAEEYKVRLLSFMEKEKPYLNANLNLTQLADDLEIPSHYLSQVINEKIGLNFFDFVNRYRVEEVKIKMVQSSYSHLSLLGIAFESGFNSKSAFNRVFKNITGTTPGGYKKSHAFDE